MTFFSTPLIAWTDKGLFCEAGGFYIDPHRRVDLAIVTHAHSDHARRGSAKYICEASGVSLLQNRLGKQIQVQGIPYGQKFKLNDVTVSFHSAGHILGSAQVRVEYQGEVWVASGDYKREPDPTCAPFEPVKCDTFITEATFGTPKFVWEKTNDYGIRMAEWWEQNAANGINSIIFGYSLGKAQRILGELAPYAKKPVLIYSTILELTECYRNEGWTLAETIELKEAVADFKKKGIKMTGEMILAPPSILDEEWMKEIGEYRTAFASGWMAGRGGWGSQSYDHGFVMSDHADWNDLNQTIEETGATRVFVQHRTGTLIRHLRKKGIDAHPVEALEVENWARMGGENLELF